MTVIFGGNNPRNAASVDKSGRLSAFAVSLSEQEKAAELGESFNINTGRITLTSAVETPLVYLSNETSDQAFKVSRIFSTFLASTGGVGEASIKVYTAITGGTILNAADVQATNFNFASGQKLPGMLKYGAPGLTFVGTPTNIELLLPTVNIRQLTGFDHIVLPKGADMLLTCTAPPGNTSMVAELGMNVFLEQSELE